MSEWADQYLTLIDDCEQREGRLSDWQRGFLDSLRRQIEAGNVPTQKQIDKLDEAWEQATARG